VPRLTEAHGCTDLPRGPRGRRTGQALSQCPAHPPWDYAREKGSLCSGSGRRRQMPHKTQEPTDLTFPSR
jgi:hypothetical protein